ncbi:MAG: hypothetical protein O2894_11005, partial [Planctomycetota bacterium]|nr:hypothetical protein [Planctomycetota bacterium]
STPRRLGADDGAMQFYLHRRYAVELAEADRFEEAARVQRAVVRTIVRGNLEDHHPNLWARHRATEDALLGAAAAARGDAAAATAFFTSARLRAAEDPDVLNGTAWYRALASFELEAAEREAVRSTTLEGRVESRPSANAVDTLAYILLLRGRGGEGRAMLEPRMREKGAVDNGLLHYHLAQMHASVGALRSARDALVEALTWDRLLGARIATDPFLAPLLAKTSADSIFALAAQRRFEQQLP